MYNIKRIFTVSCLFWLSCPVTNLLARQPTRLMAAIDSMDRWESLLDGTHPNVRWQSIKSDRFPDEGWQIEDGVLSVSPGRKGGDLITRERFSNFELELDFMLADSANTGIKYLVAPLKNAEGKTVLNGPEYQLIDDYRHASVIGNRSPETSTGSLYLLFAPEDKILHKAGEWNRLKIIVNGNAVEHWLNGKRILSYNRKSDIFRQRVSQTKFNEYQTGYGEAESGHILIQDHGDRAFFRNIRIRRLK